MNFNDQSAVRFHFISTAVLDDVIASNEVLQYHWARFLKENVFNFSLSTEPAGGLATLGAGAIRVPYT